MDGGERLKYLSVCSGIESASVAWHPLGWVPLAFAETEPFPSAVLKHHYHDVPNLGDMNAYATWPDYRPNVVVGGTPCQSFSVAGLRKGLADPRGNLALVFLGVVDRYRPRWVVWENVPGVLSSDSGQAIGSFLGALGELGYGWAYRSLDAQYFDLAQRRERVFVVGHLGDWRPPAAVLFEPESLSGHPAPRREARQDVAGTIGSRTSAGGGLGTDFECDGGLVPAIQSSGPPGTRRDELPIAMCLNAGGMGRQDAESETMIVTHSLRADGFDASEDGTGRGTPLVVDTLTSNGDAHSGYRDEKGLVPIAIQERAICENSDAGPDGVGVRTDGLSYTLEARTVPQAVAFSLGCHAGAADGDVSNRSHANGGPAGSGISEEVSHSLRGGRTQSIASAMQVRRLTPRECERLMGFPDDYTLVPYRGKPACDGPRYKALGNSKAVPVVRWLGSRIAMVDALLPK